MLLAVDLGNSNIKCGLFSGARLVRSARWETRADRSAEEHAALLRELCASHGVGPALVDAAVVASVVPALTPVLVAALRAGFGCEPLVFDGAMASGLVMRVERPEQVGADRILNAVAARDVALREAGASADAELARGVIAVDLGTATKLDCLSPRGEFLGGVIAPGVQISLDALVSRAAKLQRVDLTAPPHAVGRNTIECIQSGIVYGHAAMVDGMIDRLRSELPFDADVITTGGLATVIAPYTRALTRIEPDLTLNGLRAVYDHQRASSR